MAEDPASSASFYSRVLGWRTEPWGADSSYTIFNATRGPVAGVSALPAELRSQGVRAHWMSFIGADDVDGSLAARPRSSAARCSIRRPTSPAGGPLRRRHRPAGRQLCHLQAAAGRGPRPTRRAAARGNRLARTHDQRSRGGVEVLPGAVRLAADHQAGHGSHWFLLDFRHRRRADGRHIQVADAGGRLAGLYLGGRRRQDRRRDHTGGRPRLQWPDGCPGRRPHRAARRPVRRHVCGALDEEGGRRTPGREHAVGGQAGPETGRAEARGGKTGHPGGRSNSGSAKTRGP